MTTLINKQDALRKLQLAELEILKTFDSFCSDNGIEWFIDSGTALGAARHGGFIPWDDDIDVGMVRSQYDKFLNIAKQQFPKGYSVHTCDNTDGYAAMFAKVYMDDTLFETEETKQANIKQGIFIDVFPYDYVPENISMEVQIRRKAKLWQSISYLYHSGSIVVPHKRILGAIEKICCTLAHRIIRVTFTPKTIYEHFRQVENYPGKKSNRLLPLAWPNMKALPDNFLLPTSQIQFEGMQFPCPARINDYLEAMYGDWKTLPSPEDRRTHLPLKIVFNDGAEWTEDGRG